MSASTAPLDAPPKPACALPPRQSLSPQARLLRKTVMGRLLRQILACLGMCVLAALLLSGFAAEPVSSALANSAPWSVYEPNSAEEETRLQAFLDSQPNAVWDIQTNPVDGTIWVRDLSLYHLVKAAWLPCLIALTAAVMLGFVFAAFRRMYGLVDELAGAVSGLLTNESKPVTLPPELSVTQAELNRLRRDSLAREEAAAKDRQRTQELMAYLAHDVRTPLTAVLGNLALLEEDSSLSASSQEELAVALARAQEMDELTSDLFDVTRLALDPTALKRQPVDLRLLTLQVLGERQHEPSTLTHREATPGCAALTVLADPKLLAKTVEHLVRSAQAIARPHSTLIMRGSANAAVALMEIQVQTSAPNPEEAQALVSHVFEPFYRTGTTSGISLGFAREIARAHGGNVFAQAQNTQAILTLELPTR